MFLCGVEQRVVLPHGPRLLGHQFPQSLDLPEPLRQFHQLLFIGVSIGERGDVPAGFITRIRGAHLGPQRDIGISRIRLHLRQREAVELHMRP